ncbi:hypothetical protein BX666DRAFT_994475 [Dichotomocladium elegans]|nr:hypothetical protein BX666DRAFT_994475 [Dichotomocladium elegans]
MVRNFYLADVITLMNGMCGIMSVFASMRYLLSEDVNDLYSSMFFMPFGLFFDFMDGRVARWRNNASLLGQELDSLADLVSIERTCVFAVFMFVSMCVGAWVCEDIKGLKMYSDPVDFDSSMARDM